MNKGALDLRQGDDVGTASLTIARAAMPSVPEPDQAGMMTLLTALWRLNRNIVDSDSERALEMVRAYMPRDLPWNLLRYPSGGRAWTWTIPEAYELEEAYLEVIEPAGPRRILDAAEHPLHVVSYSPPVDREMDFAELSGHLHHNPQQPTGIPWVYKFYERDWGFCLTEEAFQALPRNRRYRAVIKSRFVSGHLPVGELTIPGHSDEFIVFIHDICHPCQVNDSISGTVVAAEVARLFARRPTGHYGLKFLFLPETIGALAYFSNNEHLIGRVRCAVNSDMIGNDNTLRLQRSRQDSDLIDRVARWAMREELGEAFHDDKFCHVFGNDEKVTNAPGVDIPTIAFNRWPFPQYHTSNDDPSIIVPENLAQVARIYVRIVDVLQGNYFPRRTYRGLLFISGLGLDFDWMETVNQKRRLMQVLWNLEGDLSVFEIAEKVGLEYALVRLFIEKLRQKGAVEASKTPWKEQSS